MIKYLEKLKHEFDCQLFTISAAVTGNIGRKHNLEHSNHLFTSIGRLYITVQEMGDRIHKLKNIKEYCTAELNGSFYDDILKELEEDCGKINYDDNTVYEWILHIEDNYPMLAIDEFTKLLLEQGLEIDNGLTKHLFNFLDSIKQQSPDIGPLTTMPLHEVQANKVVGDCVMMDQLEGYNQSVSRVFKIAEEKGNLGEIIKLIG